MATSPNYSWPEPDNTDLVKNGALAIRTMGNAIDTTMATMTPKSTYTAKGSIAAATGASTPANLSVGNNGETLVADSSTSTGLRYNPQNALVNPIINGGMDNWQRGTSVAGSGVTRVYTADRWQADTGSQLTFSRQAVNDSTNLPNIQYSARVQRTAGSTSVGTWNFVTSVETAMAVPLAGKTVTLSFYAKRGANYSATSNLLSANLFTGTGTDQNVYSGYTGSVTTNGSVTLTTSWQRFAIVYTFPSTMTEFALQFTQTPPASTAGADDWFEITGVQIDLGTYSATTAPSFRRSGGTIQGELAACQRYFEKTYDIATAPGTSTNNGMAMGPMATVSGSNNINTISYKVQKRTTPTLKIYTPNGTADLWITFNSGGGSTNRSLTLSGSGEYGFGGYIGTSTDFFFQGHWTASAEL